jgi:hypothetical protein
MAALDVREADSLGERLADDRRSAVLAIVTRARRR